MDKKMKFKITTTAVFSSIIMLIVFEQNAFAQRSSEKDLTQKVDSVLSLMTLEEKVGQLTLFSTSFSITGPTIRDDYADLVKQGKVGAIFNAHGHKVTRDLQRMAVEETRLGIPLLFGLDVIHGFRTIFPIPLGETASWDTTLTEKTARAAALEASAAGVQWTFAPMVDVTRDARWGRIAEGAGEDTHMNTVMARSRVRGFQGSNFYDLTTVLATAKHYAAYGAPFGGRDYNTVNMSERHLREIYLPPFEASIDENVATFMTAFNELNGVPATGNKFLMNDILRDEWNFDGFVVTDYTSIPEMIDHGYAANDKEAAHLALDANVDMDMQSGLYLNQLPQLVEEGSVDIEQIDQAVARILEMKFKLGLFEDPYRYSNEERQEQNIMTEENLELAREMARESIVLLKNNNQTLPLDKNMDRLAVIGPLSDSKEHLLGSWAGVGRAEDNITVMDGIMDKLSSQTELVYSRGAELTGDSKKGFDRAVKAAQGADAAVVVLGEERLMSGEAASRATLDLPGVQQELLQEIHATGTPVVLVLMSGRPLAVNWADENIPAILKTWYLGTQGGNAIADILFGDDNPSGKLPVTFPRHAGQIPYHYNHKNTGRPISDGKYTSKYIDVPNSPLYPFGYGLSYTTFEYSNMEISSEEITADETLSVSVDVTNTGERIGEEVVQLYIRDLYASITRPVKELRDFHKLELEAGDIETVTFTLSRSDLAFYNADMEKVVEPGEFHVFVGTNSQDVQQKVFHVVSK